MGQLMQSEILELFSLFASSFVSSTIAPGGSEAVLAYMVSENKVQVPVLVSIATIGNTLGAMTTWILGYIASKKYPLEALLSSKNQKTINWVKKWGYWSLLFSWLPIIGDGFCFAGGWLKFSLFFSSILILIGKLGRYTLIAWMFA